MLVTRAEERIVEKERFPCPQEIEFNCLKTFVRLPAAKTHANKSYKSHKPYPCPMAVEFRRSEAFSDPQLAKTYVNNKHDGKIFPRPRLKLLHCPELFSTVHETRFHANVLAISQPKYVNGLKTGTHNDSPKIYDKEIDGHLRKCTVPACRPAVSKVRMSELDMDKHMLHHEYAEHLEDQTPYPTPVAAKKLDPEEVKELLITMDIALEEERDKDNGNQDTVSQLDSDMNSNINIEGVILYHDGTVNMITRDDRLEYIRQYYENQQSFSAYGTGRSRKYEVPK